MISGRNHIEPFIETNAMNPMACIEAGELREMDRLLEQLDAHDVQTSALKVEQSRFVTDSREIIAFRGDVAVVTFKPGSGDWHPPLTSPNLERDPARLFEATPEMMLSQPWAQPHKNAHGTAQEWGPDTPVGVGASDGGGMAGKYRYQLAGMERRDKYRREARKRAGELCAGIFLARKAVAEVGIVARMWKAARRRFG